MFTRIPELNVTVVIRKSKFLFSLFNFETTGNILWTSPILAAWNHISFFCFLFTGENEVEKIFSLYLFLSSLLKNFLKNIITIKTG